MLSSQKCLREGPGLPGARSLEEKSDKQYTVTSPLIEVVGAKEEGPLTLTQIGCIREKPLTEVKMEETSKMDLCLGLDITPY